MMGPRLRQIKATSSDPSVGSTLKKGTTKKKGVSFSLSLSDPLVLSTLVFAILDLIGFLISISTGTHLHLDLVGTGAFFVSTAVVWSLSPAGAPSSSLPICLWSFRLAAFLFYRATVVREDKRLGETLQSVSGTFGFWFISALWGVICTLPSRFAWFESREAASKKQPGFVALVPMVGWLLFVLGFLFECVADYQKWMFKLEGSKGPMMTGVWSTCQHPNYTGEIALWLGVYLIDFPRLFSRFGWKSIAFFISPIFTSALLAAQSLGYLAPTLELAAEKYKQFPEYTTYIAETPLFIPKPLSV